MEAGVPASRFGAAQSTFDEIDLGVLGRALWRKKRWIVGLTLLTAAIAFAGVNLVTPRYRSEARILIETRENIFLRPEAERTLERSMVDQEAVTSQVQLVLSRDLAREVIRKLRLDERPEFDPTLSGGSIIFRILGMVGIVRESNMTADERVLKSYFERLAAYQVEKSRVIAIEFDSEDPDLAARVTNAIAENYLVLQQTAKQEQARSAGQWLAGEITHLRRSVSEAEAKVEDYRSRSNLFMGANNTTLSNQQLGDFNAQLVAARAQKSDAEAKSKLIREALHRGAEVEFSDIVNSELIRRLSEQRVTLRAQLAEQSSTLLDQHPRIKELKAQIADLERQIRSEADRLARSLENDAKLASARVEGLSAGLDQLKRQATSSNEQDVQLRALERDAKSQRDLLESYLAKYRETNARDNIEAASPDARIISTAVVSNTPAWPKKLPIVLVATLAMFALCSGFVLTGELLSATPALGSAVLPVRAVTAGVQPAVSSAAPPIVAMRDTFGVPLESVEKLAGELKSADPGRRRITVVGSTRNVGTTFAAIALARSLAKEARVVLVDLAFDAPNLFVIAADPSTPTMADLVRGDASFGQIVTRDRFSSVHLVLAGQAGEADSVVSSQRLAITLEALGRSYDYLIIDAGALPTAAINRLAPLAPHAVFVTKIDGRPAADARDRLVGTGFTDFSVLAAVPLGPESKLPGSRAAA